jgi:hypothetical protein
LASKKDSTPQKDIFQRATFGAGIANLLRESSDPLTIVLDSAWGTGKTIFIKMLAGHLRNEGFPVIYFDAFENDHVDNGFLAIAGEVIRLSNELRKSKTPQHKQFVKKVTRAGGILLRMGAKVGVKAATLGAIDAADFEGLKSVAEDIAKEASTKADEYVESLLKLQAHDRETLRGVRESLSELAGCLASKSNSAGSNERPLVFIIDELDRCRPTFALELLEKIKHVFSIPNVHFILSTNLSQLENTVQVSYGAGIDARMYLQKFYNVILNFPEAGRYPHERVIPRYINHLKQVLSIDSDDLTLLEAVAEAKQLSLRVIERIVTCIALARIFTPKNYLWLSPIIAGLAIIKIVDPVLFRNAVLGNITLDQIKDVFVTYKWPTGQSSSHAWIMRSWTYCLDPTALSEADRRGFEQHLFRYSIDEPKRIIRLMSQHMDRLKLPEGS